MIKPVSILIALLIAAGGTGIGVYAVNSSDTAQAWETDEKSNEKNEKEEKEESERNLKDETVYVLSSADGTAEKIIVSDWLKNTLSSSEISDSTELSDVVNIKGSESLNNGKWNSDGGDIYYTGTIEKSLPVAMSVSYTLDGKSVSSEEIKGKSGSATIRFTYRNNQKETVTVDGETKEMYVPFAVLTGVILDNDIFGNVEVTNGRLLNDGDRTVIAGFALPGMQENLGIDRNDIEIPDYFEISAKVNNFELSETITVITNEAFNDIDIDGGELEELDSLSELSDAVDQLCDGSDKLYDGLSELLEKSGELIEGIDKLAEGAEALNSGVSDLADGSARLEDGTEELAQGLDTLKENSEALNSGSMLVFNALLETAGSQLKAAGLEVPALTPDNYGEVLEGVLNSLDESNVRISARQQVEQAVRARENEVEAAVAEAVKAEIVPKVEAAVKENVTAQVLAALELTPESYKQGVQAGIISAEQQDRIAAAVETQMSSDAAQAAIAQNLEAQLQSEEVKEIISAKTEEQIGLLVEENMKSDEVLSRVSAAVSGRASVEGLLAQLDSYNQFYTGLKAYTEGVDKAADGAAQLRSGASSLNGGAVQLKDGTARLYDGIITLRDSAPALIDGITRLRDGSKELSEGMYKFRDEGVQKIIDAIDGDVKGLLDNLKASKEASEKYNTFSGIDESMDGQVKFIYRTESIK